LLLSNEKIQLQSKNIHTSAAALDLEKLIANRFNRLLWRISNFGEGSDLTAHKLSLTEWRVMAQLGTYGRMPIGKLANLSGVGQTVGSRAVKSLKAKHCVETRKSSKDSRQLLVQLSDYGMQVHDTIAPNRARAHQQVQHGLSASELSTMLSLCDKLEEHLTLLESNDADGW
jgi:DNA-binding MarR family transcriptional regulator